MPFIVTHLLLTLISLIISHFFQIINGLLDGGDIAAGTSAAAAARKVSRRRSINQPPTTIRHLNDKVVNQLIANTEKACMKVAAATQPQADVELGDAFTTTMVYTISNVLCSDKNGGCINVSLMNGYKWMMMFQEYQQQVAGGDPAEC